MCRGCWEEDGAPRIATDETRFAALFIAAAGEDGPLHIVIADDNYEDHSLEFCRREAEQTGASIIDWACLDVLEALSFEERVSASAIAYGYIPPYPSSAWPCDHE